jgi:hypothetical protein
MPLTISYAVLLTTSVAMQLALASVLPLVLSLAQILIFFQSGEKFVKGPKQTGGLYFGGHLSMLSTDQSIEIRPSTVFCSFILFHFGNILP